MKLYLVRHGDAVTESTDPARPLSIKGRQDVSRVARHLDHNNVRVADIRHSSKTRAAETAALLAEAVADGHSPQCIDGLLPNDRVEPVAEMIGTARNDVMLVGHLPFMPALANHLLGRPEAGAFTAGTVLVMQRSDGSWSIVERIAPEQIS